MNLKKELLEFVANIDDWTNIHEHAEEIVNDYLEQTGKNLMLCSSYTQLNEKYKTDFENWLNKDFKEEICNYWSSKLTNKLYNIAELKKMYTDKISV